MRGGILIAPEAPLMLFRSVWPRLGRADKQGTAGKRGHRKRGPNKKTRRSANHDRPCRVQIMFLPSQGSSSNRLR